jgi:hypothetical protein
MVDFRFAVARSAQPAHVAVAIFFHLSVHSSCARSFIVKNMLLHSREGSGECRPVEINAVIDEILNLAYHGARAEKRV